MLTVLTIFIFFLFLQLARRYRVISRELKRLDSNFSSQFLSLINETVSGIEVIRSLGNQAFQQQKFMRKINNQITSNYVNDCL